MTSQGSMSQSQITWLKLVIIFSPLPAGCTSYCIKAVISTGEGHRLGLFLYSPPILFTSFSVTPHKSLMWMNQCRTVKLLCVCATQFVLLLEAFWHPCWTIGRPSWLETAGYQPIGNLRDALRVGKGNCRLTVLCEASDRQTVAVIAVSRANTVKQCSVWAYLYRLCMCKYTVIYEPSQQVN